MPSISNSKSSKEFLRLGGFGTSGGGNVCSLKASLKFSFSSTSP